VDAVLAIFYGIIVLGFLVVIHEGGHYLSARAFGVRVSEFMVGLPGPRVGFMWHGTRFGVTAVPLGGYARVCGMEPGEESPYLKQVLGLVLERGEVLMEDAARALSITDDEAYAALDELSEWGTIAGPGRKDTYNVYRTLSSKAAGDGGTRAEGEPMQIDDLDAFFESERAQQYRSLPFWKRCVILLAGPVVNLIFAILVFLVVYSLVGVDVTNPNTGELVHIQVDPLRSIQAGFSYIGMVVMAVAGLFNPQTAADTVQNSSSVIGVAAMSKTAADQGLLSFAMFTAMISVSLGIMNLLPIPPLDGGRFVVEIYQRIRRVVVSPRALNRLSLAGMAFFLALFVVMANQDIQRFILGNWS
jgi:regulator of sigma E protease